MLEALREYAPRGLRWNEPAGGFYLWCHLEEGLRAKDLLVEAAARGVAFVVGEAFHADGGGQGALRLNFTYHDEQGLREGIRRLGKGLEGLMRERRGRRKAPLAAVRPIV
jgi:2-aminoadipate transaminase